MSPWSFENHNICANYILSIMSPIISEGSLNLETVPWIECLRSFLLLYNS